MADPLPQAMILTAIVITLGVTAFLLAMAYRSWQLQGNDEVQDDAEDRRIAADVPLGHHGVAQTESEGFTVRGAPLQGVAPEVVDEPVSRLHGQFDPALDPLSLILQRRYARTVFEGPVLHRGHVPREHHALLRALEHLYSGVHIGAASGSHGEGRRQQDGHLGIEALRLSGGARHPVEIDDRALAYP